MTDELSNPQRSPVEAERQQTASSGTVAERLLVCVGTSPTTAKLLHSAKRMATAFGCPWLAVAVSSGTAAQASDQRQQRVAQHLQLAERLGAETHTLIGLNVADTVLAFARTRSVTKIVVGKTAQPWWRQVLFSTVVDELLERSGAMDVYVIRGEGAADENREPPTWRRPGGLWKPYLATAGIIAVCGLLGWLSHSLGLSEANIVMIFLLGVVLVATRYGRGPAIVSAIANVLVFDFFFVPPKFSLTVHDAQYLFTFGVMLGIGLLVSALTARIHEQLEATQQQERRAAALYRLTQQLSEMYGSEFLIRAAGRQLLELFPGEVVICVREPSSTLGSHARQSVGESQRNPRSGERGYSDSIRFGEETSIALDLTNQNAMQWVIEHGQIAGAGAKQFPNATAVFLPLIGSQRTVGALGVKPLDEQRLLDVEQRRLLETCARLIALAIERDQSVLEAQAAQVQVQTEQLRNSLLSSVSHDLRTPLAAIYGSAASLLDCGDGLSDSSRRELLQSVAEESQRLSRLVDNLLEMTRLESGALALNRQWQVLEEIVGSALSRVRGMLGDRSVQTQIASDFPLVKLDGVLFEQVLINLLENAARYTPADSRIEISANASPHQVEICVADNGPGLPVGQESKVFEKFFRGHSSAPDSRRGVGLGLAICQGIVQAHGGSIRAQNRPTGGAEFVITLPLDEPPPSMPP